MRLVVEPKLYSASQITLTAVKIHLKGTGLDQQYVQWKKWILLMTFIQVEVAVLSTSTK